MSFYSGLLLSIAILCIITKSTNAQCKHEINEEFETPKSLQMVSIIFRHGHRSPVSIYPNDPHINYTWDGELGALSRKGAKDMYNFGKTLRTRYGGFIKEHSYYTSEVMQFNSSDVERCLKSASSLIAGLLPPPIDNEHSLPFPWQPVPIHTIPTELDIYIAAGVKCSRYDRDLDETLKYRSSIATKEEKNFIEFIRKKSGADIMNHVDLLLLQNTLEIEKLENLKLPAWTENGVFENMTAYAKETFLLHTYTPFMKKVKGGPLITTILDNMINQRRNKRKLFLYSGHDSTVAAVQNALNILNQTTTLPDFGATLLFELHENPILKDDSEVKILYYFSNLEKAPIGISIPNCSAPCSLKKFSATIKHLIVRDFQTLCY